MNTDIINKLYATAIKNEPFESAGVDEKYRPDFEKLIQELEDAPAGVQPMLINEWVGDEYNDLVALIEDGINKVEVAKAMGNYEVTKAEGEKRYTLGAMYIPDRLDAHGEWTDAEELQRAVWNYVKSDDRRIRLQHNRDVVAGEWVEVMAFPYEITVPIQTISGVEVNHTYPPNTVFLGVIWEPWAWEMVKEGKILGYSIGGKAERMYVDMEKADGPTVSDVHVDTIMNPKKKKKLPAVQVDEELSKTELPLNMETLTKTILSIMEKNQPVINVIMPDEKPKTRRVERDENGNITRIVEE